MKKLFAVFLILLFAFSGCGTESTDVNKDVTASPSPDKATVEKESKEENSETVAFELGTAENGVYKNNYLGIRCNLPEWEFSSREELDAELELVSVKMYSVKTVHGNIGCRLITEHIVLINKGGNTNGFIL